MPRFRLVLSFMASNLALAQLSTPKAKKKKACVWLAGWLAYSVLIVILVFPKRSNAKKGYDTKRTKGTAPEDTPPGCSRDITPTVRCLLISGKDEEKSQSEELYYL